MTETELIAQTIERYTDLQRIMKAADPQKEIKNNCQIYTTSYVGNGKHGQANPITLTYHHISFVLLRHLD